MRNLEVGHTDRARTTVFLELLERLPRRNEVAVVERRQRPVNKEQVDVVVTERLERALERAPRVLGAVEAVVELARDVDLAAIKARGANGLADSPLVAVHLRRVDVPIADLERMHDGAPRLVRRDLEDAEAQLRDCLGVIQRDRRRGQVDILPEVVSSPSRTRVGKTTSRPTSRGGLLGTVQEASGWARSGRATAAFQARRLILLLFAQICCRDCLAAADGVS